MYIFHLVAKSMKNNNSNNKNSLLIVMAQSEDIS